MTDHLAPAEPAETVGRVSNILTADCDNTVFCDAVDSARDHFVLDLSRVVPLTAEQVEEIMSGFDRAAFAIAGASMLLRSTVTSSRSGLFGRGDASSSAIRQSA